jgi:lipopolysaccharide heptosyltransferase I
MTTQEASIPLPQEPQRILLIKPSSIGDVVHAIPVWRALRKKWPMAKISWLIAPACANLIEGLSDLELILFERKRLGQSWKSLSALKELLAFQKSLRDRHFDLVVDLQGLLRSAWFARCTRAPLRVGFANAREMGWMFYTHRVSLYTMEQHAVLRNMSVAAALGCPPDEIGFELPITEQDRAAARELVPDEAPFALICPGANWPSKRWPLPRFAELPRLLEKRLGMRTVVAGGADEVVMGAQIPGARSICGQTTLRQLAAVMQRASIVITNDSGPLHIASALNRPLVCLFGPTNPVRTGPFRQESSVVRLEMDCSPCYRRTCADCRCLERIDSSRVMEAVEAQLHHRAADQLSDAWADGR